MRIYFLDRYPWNVPHSLCDLHLNKLLNEAEEVFTNNEYNHPVAKWVRENKYNTTWYSIFVDNLLGEFSYRFGFDHRFQRGRNLVLSNTYHTIRQEIGGDRGFSDENVDQVLLERMTLPPMDLGSFYSDIFTDKLNTPEFYGEDAWINEMPGGAKQWQLLAETHRIYYIFECLPKQWCSWKRGSTPNFVMKFQKENSIWKPMLATMPAKISMPSSRVELDAAVEMYDPSDLPKKPIKSAKTVEKKKIVEEVKPLGPVDHAWMEPAPDIGPGW